MRHTTSPRARRRRLVALAVVGSAIAVPTAIADASPKDGRKPVTLGHAGSFFVTENLRPGEPGTTPTSAEIVDVTDDGRTALYTDGFTSRLGFIDVSDADEPRPLGAMDLPGDPTSVAVHKRWALVAVKTSGDDFVNPTGELLVIDIASRTVVRSFDVGGQPDAVAVAPSGRYAAVAIENERNESLNRGLIPQLPGGDLKIIDLNGNRPSAWGLRRVALNGLATVAPDDPEPEYVDINDRDEAVVSLQENNHLVVVDLRSGRVRNHFSAGSVTLTNVDATRERIGVQRRGLIELTQTIERRREPDAVHWIDDDTFATANEGDYTDAGGVLGGSRSFTLFNKSGAVEYEAGASFEYEVIRHGHFNEARSGSKGIEPEGLEVGRVRGRTLLFVGSERGNAVGVYDVSSGTPRFVQLLPTGIGPEGLKFTKRGTLIVSSEVDGLGNAPADQFPARPVITLFETDEATYPQLVSGDTAGLPIPWVAMSGLSADPSDPDTLWGVSDSILARAYVYRIDVSDEPARIVERIPVGPADNQLDFEGVAARPEGGFWFASEGRTNTGSTRPNQLVRTDASGAVLQTVTLPPALLAFATSNGFEGVAVTGTAAGGDETLYAVIQREWGDDPAGSVKVAKYVVATGTWTFARYPLGAVESPNGGWIGLSEVSVMPDGRLLIVERDNQIGLEARVKRLFTVDPAEVTFAPYGGPLPTLTKTPFADVIDELDEASISVPEKLEGTAVTADGRIFLVTDNDGLDGNYGETVFIELD